MEHHLRCNARHQNCKKMKIVHFLIALLVGVTQATRLGAAYDINALESGHAASCPTGDGDMQLVAVANNEADLAALRQIYSE